MLGLPSFIVGSVAFGLVLVGVVPASAAGESLPIILGSDVDRLVSLGRGRSCGRRCRTP